jgi:hypothetical protein
MQLYRSYGVRGLPHKMWWYAMTIHHDVEMYRKENMFP